MEELIRLYGVIGGSLPPGSSFGVALTLGFSLAVLIHFLQQLLKIYNEWILTRSKKHSLCDKCSTKDGPLPKSRGFFAGQPPGCQCDSSSLDSTKTSDKPSKKTDLS